VKIKKEKKMVFIRHSKSNFFKVLLTLSLLLTFSLGFAQHCQNEVKEDEQVAIKKVVLMNSTQIAAQGLGSIIANLPQAEKIKMCRKFIKSIRFFDDKSGYFYIYALDGTNIAHATQPDFEGKNLMNIKDSRGNLSLQESIKCLKEKKFGVINFENPNTKKEEKKIIFAEMIPGTDYFIGSGFYLDK